MPLTVKTGMRARKLLICTHLIEVFEKLRSMDIFTIGQAAYLYHQIL
jgi:hypothetical protein